MLTNSSGWLVSKLAGREMLCSMTLVLMWIMPLRTCYGWQQSKEIKIPTATNDIDKDTNKGVKVGLLFDKEEYFLGENILLHYCITNQEKEPFTINTGGDYRGSPRHLRFKVLAFDANNKQVGDPYPTIMNMGGLGGDSTLEPGQSWWTSLPLMRYCDFENPGVYKIRVYHDLGWDNDYYDNLFENDLPKGEHKAPVVETSIKLAMPNSEQAKQVIDYMLTLPSDPMAVFGEKTREYIDLSVVRYPVYLPLVLDLVNNGDPQGLEAIGAIATPEATRILIELSNNDDKNISIEALKLLLQRLPIPKTQENVLWNRISRERLIKKSWRTEMKADVLEYGWELLSKNDKDSLIYGAYIIRCLGSEEDIVTFETFLDQGLIAMKDDLVEQGSYPRPRTVSDSLIDAGWELLELGADVPTDTNSPGCGILFMLALGNRDDFRPEGWQATSANLLKHSIPIVRAMTLKNLPKEFPSDDFNIIEKLIEDEYIYVQISACQFANKTLSSQFQSPLMNVLSTTRDEWLFRQAFNTALACGVYRDNLMEISIERLANDDMAVTILDILNEIVDRGGGWGYSQVDWSNVNHIKAEWKKFIDNNRERIR